MYKISIIIPIYNGEFYIERCIEKLQHQTLEEIEIICVDDGSTDKTKTIIKNLQKKDSRSKYLYQTNGRQGKARNTGLTHAKGKYIHFLDVDDYIDKNMYLEMYNRALETSADIVICDYYIVDEKSNNKKYFKVINTSERPNVSLKEYVLSTPSPCNKIYKSSFLKENNFKFLEGLIYEDYATIPTLVLYNPRVIYIDRPFYYYIQSTNSTMRNETYKSNYEDVFLATEYLYNSLISSKSYIEELEYIIINHFLYYASLLFYKFKKYDQIDKISQFMKRKFPNWQKNKYFKRKDFRYKILCFLFYHKNYNFIKIIQLMKGRYQK